MKLIYLVLAISKPEGSYGYKETTIVKAYIREDRASEKVEYLSKKASGLYAEYINRCRARRQYIDNAETQEERREKIKKFHKNHPPITWDEEDNDGKKLPFLYTTFIIEELEVEE